MLKFVFSGELLQHVVGLDKDEDFAVYCNSCKNVYNVKGGITAWSEEIDLSVPKYQETPGSGRATIIWSRPSSLSKSPPIVVATKL